MVRGKRIREKGKIRLSEYFKSLKEGDRVSIIREKSLPVNFLHRMQGRSGTVTGKRGGAYIVSIKDIGKEKTYIIKPIHLKKLQGVNKL